MLVTDGLQRGMQFGCLEADLRLYISILSQCCRRSSGTTNPELVPTMLPEASAVECTVQVLPGHESFAMSIPSDCNLPTVYAVY